MATGLGAKTLGVSGICWDAATEQLLIAYQNSNLDVLDVKGRTKNIGDIQRSNFPGNKIIRNLYCANGLGYLSTGLGIIVVNLRKYEIKDTWVIGNNGIQTGVSGFTQLNNFFYAATDEGLKQIEKEAIKAVKKVDAAEQAALKAANKLETSIEKKNKKIAQIEESEKAKGIKKLEKIKVSTEKNYAEEIANRKSRKRRARASGKMKERNEKCSSAFTKPFWQCVQNYS